MRPIAYGLIIFFGSGILWFLFTILAAFEAFTGRFGVFTALMCLNALMCLFSLPAAIIAEIVQWYRRRKRKEPES